MKKTNKTEYSVKNRNNDDVKPIIDHFISTVSQLEAILTKETDCLKVSNRNAFLNLQEEKVLIAQTYQQDIFAVKNIATILKDKYPNLIPYLQEKQEKLGGIIRENETALKRMENSTKRLSDRIMDVARRAAIEQNSIVYGSGGQLNDKNRATMGVSESA